MTSLKTEEYIEAAVKFFNTTIQSSGWNATPEHTDILETYVCPMLITKKKTSKKEDDSVEGGTDYEHQRAKDYVTQQHRNSNNSSITKLIASKHSCQVLHQQNPLTTPCGRWPRK
jgi:hypothetical protein